jgi:hypothetical protein
MPRGCGQGRWDVPGPAQGKGLGPSVCLSEGQQQQQYRQQQCEGSTSSEKGVFASSGSPDQWLPADRVPQFHRLGGGLRSSIRDPRVPCTSRDVEDNRPVSLPVDDVQPQKESGPGACAPGPLASLRKVS